MNKLLKFIDTEGEQIRLKLNKGRCSLINIACLGHVKFRDGTNLRPSNEVKYLGCHQNKKQQMQTKRSGNK